MGAISFFHLLYFILFIHPLLFFFLFLSWCHFLWLFSLPFHISDPSLSLTSISFPFLIFLNFLHLLFIICLCFLCYLMSTFSSTTFHPALCFLYPLSFISPVSLSIQLYLCSSLFHWRCVIIFNLPFTFICFFILPIYFLLPLNVHHLFYMCFFCPLNFSFTAQPFSILLSSQSILLLFTYPLFSFFFNFLFSILLSVPSSHFLNFTFNPQSFKSFNWMIEGRVFSHPSSSLYFIFFCPPHHLQ